jgi:hypothetical protein
MLTPRGQKLGFLLVIEGRDSRIPMVAFCGSSRQDERVCSNDWKDLWSGRAYFDLASWLWSAAVQRLQQETTGATRYRRRTFPVMVSRGQAEGALHSRITENSIAAAKKTNTRVRERIMLTS